MAEIEKQENQKTVVAFIAGLLIGGLLVWIFSSTPDTQEATNDESAEEEESETRNVSKENVSPVTTNTNTPAQVTTGSGSITIADQKAGKTVALGTVRYPATSGWIVIRDYMDGVPGNILGAARYNTEEGLIPTSIELMRETVADNSYQASFFTNEGAIGFKLGEDKPVEGIAASFEATK